MKKLGLFLSALALTSFAATAQSADEIIDNYYDVTGGKDNWGKVKGIQMEAKVNQGGMEIPVTVIQMANGNEMVIVSLQGQEFIQGAFDGESLWSTNFQTMKAEKADEETLKNKKREMNDFPDPLFNYKKNGYTAEYVGKETIEGTETHKIKLTKKPILVDGAEVPNIEYYFFDTDNGVLIAVEGEVPSGPAKGSIGQSTFSDYQEVDGLYFPFSISQGIKNQGSQPMNLDKVILNPEVTRSFSFPEQTEDEEATQN